ncbi:3-hydroxyacyl-CoA dehydrogenase NAD-binding domain-containing protein [Aurantivibrio plasticivorans]
MAVSYELIGETGVITIDNPPVNALSHVVREGVKNAVIAAQSDSSKAVIILCSGRTFIAGADISEFGKPAIPPSLPQVLSVIENSEKPVIAALHGSALGGGFELALACHYRCATSPAKVGLPEVKLGLLPGAGGTQRVPRLAGVEAALDLITSGKPISTDKANKLGLVDRIITGNLREGALEYAQEVVLGDVEPRTARNISISPKEVPEGIFESYKIKLGKRARGQLAPQSIVTCIQAAVELPMDEGLNKERELFLECRDSEQSAALRHMFFAERTAPKIKGLAEGIESRAISRVAIIGGGTMGCGIAMCFANAGIPVTLLEISAEALGKGLQIIDRNYDLSVKKGVFSSEEGILKKGFITGTTKYEDLSDCDLVIEAVFESFEVKKEVFSRLDKVCKPEAILATNTSYLDVNAIAEITSRPENVVGLHFFSPANIMKLLEVVRGEKTSDEVLATAMNIAKKIRKVPVLAGVCFGFIGNRMLRQYVRETQLCLIEGASPEQIDQVMEDWGMAMGPLAVGDLSGLDVAYKARQSLSDQEKGDPKTYCIADALVEKGRLGQKVGKGYYLYGANNRGRTSDPEVLEIINGQALKHGVVRSEISDGEILMRLTLALINEGFKILEEGIAQRPSDIDAVYVFGYGFPAFRGGPMFYADQLGLKKVHEMICKLQETNGYQYWAPATLLEELAHSNKTLAEWADS